MADTTIKKVDGTHSPTKGAEKLLASGTHVSMRMWEDEEPGTDKPEHRSSYETVGYVVKGRAELHSEGQTITLEPGDSYVVPRDAKHRYKILETFTAVEATSPPAQVQ